MVIDREKGLKRGDKPGQVRTPVTDLRTVLENSRRACCGARVPVLFKHTQNYPDGKALWEPLRQQFKLHQGLTFKELGGGNDKTCLTEKIDSTIEHQMQEGLTRSWCNNLTPVLPRKLWGGITATGLPTARQPLSQCDRDQESAKFLKIILNTKADNLSVDLIFMMLDYGI